MAANYYVATDGNDSHAGGITTPWLTPLQAWTVADVGDTVFFRTGTYTLTSVVWTKTIGHNGTAAHPIVFCNYPGEAPLFSSDLAVDGILIIERNYNTIHGIHFGGTGATEWIHFGYDLEPTNLVIDSCIVNMNAGGDNAAFISVHGDSCTVKNTSITGPGLISNGIHANTSCIIILRAQGLKAYHNVLHHAPMGIYFKHANNGNISNTGIDIAYNYIYDNDRWSIFTNSNHAHFHDNLIGAGSTDFGVNEANGVPGGDYNFFNHNTIFTGSFGLVYDTDVGDSLPGAIGDTLKNNLFVNIVGIHAGSNAVAAYQVSDYNLVLTGGNAFREHNNYYTLSQWVTYAQMDNHSVAGAPIFTGGITPATIAGFALASNSPGYHAGNDGKSMGANVDSVGIKSGTPQTYDSAYTVQVSADTFKTITITTTTADTFYTVASPLSYATKYQARVRSINPDTVGVWSDTANFTTETTPTGFYDTLWSIAGTGGTISPASKHDTCTAIFRDTATAATHYAFTSWAARHNMLTIPAPTNRFFAGTFTDQSASKSDTIYATFSCIAPTRTWAQTSHICSLGVPAIPWTPTLTEADSTHGRLPAGLAKNKTTGQITGTPTGSVGIAKTAYPDTVWGCSAAYGADTITVVDTAHWCVLTATASTGGTVTTPASGKDSALCNSGHTIVAAYTQGYRFDRWTRSSTAVTIADSTAASTTATGTGAVTANFKPLTFTLTMVNATPAGTISPTAGAHTLDSGATQAISFTPPAGYGKANPTWTFSTGVIPNADSTTVYLKQNGTATAADTATYVYSNITVSAVGGGTTTPSGAQSVHCLSNLNIAATDAAGHHFTAWTSSANIAVGNPAIKITTATTTDSAAGWVKANFDTSRYALTLTAGTGTTLTPASQTVDSAAVIQLHATCPHWYTWVNFTGTGGYHFSNANDSNTTVWCSANASVTSNATIKTATAPILVYPANGDTTINKGVTARWRLVISDSAYVVDCDTTALFNSPLFVRDTTKDTIRTFALTRDNTVYYWRVKGFNNGGVSVYSTAWTFKTAATGNGNKLAGPTTYGLKNSIWSLISKKK